MSSLAACNPAAPVPFMGKVGCETLTARVCTCRQGEDVPVRSRGGTYQNEQASFMLFF